MPQWHHPYAKAPPRGIVLGCKQTVLKTCCPVCSTECGLQEQSIVEGEGSFRSFLLHVFPIIWKMNVGNKVLTWHQYKLLLLRVAHHVSVSTWKNNAVGIWRVITSSLPARERLDACLVWCYKLWQSEGVSACGNQGRPPPLVASPVGRSDLVI